MSMRLGMMAAASAAAVANGPVIASAGDGGQWRFEPSRCPDLVEDYRDRRESRRDERRDYGPADRAEDRRDRRESRRDERVTVCPASAWVWDGPSRRHASRPDAVKVYYDVANGRYYRYGPERSQITIVITDER